jgi:hypothetical protein
MNVTLAVRADLCETAQHGRVMFMVVHCFVFTSIIWYIVELSVVMKTMMFQKYRLKSFLRVFSSSASKIFSLLVGL